jgi:hypothetical protein
VAAYFLPRSESEQQTCLPRATVNAQSCRAALPEELMIQLTSPAEGIGDGEHEEFGERDTLDKEKRAVGTEYS